jgi:anti-sigma factor RsiW
MERRPDAMTSCDSEAARLLPWFATGRLSPDETARVETHLAGCAACRADLAGQRELRQVLEADDRLEYSPQPSLQKLMTRIDELERELSEPTSGPGSAVGEHFGRGAVSRWLVAALVVQTVGLALLGSLLWGRSTSVDDTSARYQTLSSTAAVPSGRDPQVRVVFAPGTDVETMTRLLQELNARVVDGPSEAGTYALVLLGPSGEAASVAKGLARLRSDARIVFAEPILQKSTRPVR